MQRSPEPEPQQQPRERQPEGRSPIPAPARPSFKDPRESREGDSERVPPRRSAQHLPRPPGEKPRDQHEAPEHGDQAQQSPQQEAKHLAFCSDQEPPAGRPWPTERTSLPGNTGSRTGAWRGVARAVALPAGSVRTGRSLDLFAARSEVPRVRGAPLLAVPGVLDQVQPRQPGEKLGDLALVGDARAFGDLPIARTRTLCDGRQDAYRSMGEAHLQASERVFGPRQRRRAAAPTGFERWPAHLTAGGSCSEIRQHDNAHQRTEQIGERLLGALEQPRVQAP